MEEVSEQEEFNELSYYTLSHRDPSFLHQNVVDAFAVQTADENSKPIGVAFGLFGLYLYLEKGFTGRQVQKAHMMLANKRKQWPKFELPEKRGEIRVGDVLNSPPGEKRDEMIHKWCQSVWEACKDPHTTVENLWHETMD